MHKKKKLLILITTIIFQKLDCFDNRFFPQSPLYLILPGKTKSMFNIRSSFGFTEKAYSTVDKEIELFHLYGDFDLGVLGRAIAKNTGTNPLRSYFYDKSIPFKIEGGLRVQEVGISCYYQIIDGIGFGVNFSCLHQQNFYNFNLDHLQFLHTDGIKEELNKARKNIFNQLGFSKDSNSLISLNDIDLFFRFGIIRDYTLKCRRINAGFRLGGFLPTSVKCDISKPSLAPSATQGTVGFYGAIDLLFELKENLKLGVFFALNKRLNHTRIERIPLLNEPYIFGATSGQVTIKNGSTILFTPYILFENLRSGIGFGIFYSLTYHTKDHWNIDETILYLENTKKSIEKNSNWASDYVRLEVLYNFNHRYKNNKNSPLLKIEWEIPTSFFVTKRIGKTNIISLSMEYNF